MNIKDMLKKYGILMVIAALFIGAIGYFAYDSNKDKVLGKSVGGKDVVASINGLDFTADDAFEAMIDGQYGGYALYLFYERAVVAASVTPDQDMNSSAKIQADQLIAQFKTEYGDRYQVVLKSALAGVGLNGEADLPGYFLHYLMLENLTEGYLEAHANELLLPYITEKKLRYASHILIKMEDSDNPTEEEEAKWEAAKSALASGKDFAEVAKEFSDDGSAASGGTLGLVTAETNFVEPFLTETLKLGHNEMTEGWVKTEFGYHLIYVTEARPEVLMVDEDVIATYMEANNAELTVKVIAEAASKLDIQFTNETYQKKLEDFMTIEAQDEE